MNKLLAFLSIIFMIAHLIIAGLWTYEGEGIKALLNVIIAYILMQLANHISMQKTLGTIMHQNDVILKQNMYLVEKKHNEYTTQAL